MTPSVKQCGKILSKMVAEVFRVHQKLSDWKLIDLEFRAIWLKSVKIGKIQIFGICPKFWISLKTTYFQTVVQQKVHILHVNYIALCVHNDQEPVHLQGADMDKMGGFGQKGRIWTKTGGYGQIGAHMDKCNTFCQLQFCTLSISALFCPYAPVFVHIRPLGRIWTKSVYIWFIC